MSKEPLAPFHVSSLTMDPRSLIFHLTRYSCVFPSNRNSLFNSG